MVASLRLRILVCICMLIFMRTTVVLDDELVKQAKKRAAELRTTLSDVINQALREVISKPPAPASHFEMVTAGSKRARVHHEPRDFAAALDEEDAPARS